MAAMQANTIVNDNIDVNSYITAIWDKVFIDNTFSLERV